MKKLLSALCAMAITNTFTGNALISTYAEDSENVTAELSDIEFTFDDISLNFTDAPEILSNNSEFSYNFRNQLDANNGAVYDAMSILTTPTTEKIIAVLPEPIKISLGHLPNTSGYTDEEAEIFSSAIFSNCKNGIDALMLDFPEIFWLDEAKLSIGIGESKTRRDWLTGQYNITINSLAFVPTYFENYGSLDGAYEYKAILEKAIEDFPVEGETRYEQLKSIHDYICNFTNYDLNADFYSSAVGAIVKPGVVCEGYSKAFKLICDRLDIPCVLIFGNFNSEERTAHMWDYVQMEDGKWYAVDVTWDDLDGKGGLELKYEYFLKGSENFNKNHTADGNHDYTNIVYPELSENDYSATTITETTTSTTSTTSTSTTTTSTTTESTTSTSTAKPQTTTTTTIQTTTTTTTESTTTVEPDLTGDLNHDGKINIADLVYCFKGVMGEKTEFSCDYNEDGLTDSFDLVLMRQLIIKK